MVTPAPATKKLETASRRSNRSAMTRRAPVESLDEAIGEVDKIGQTDFGKAVGLPNASESPDFEKEVKNAQILAEKAKAVDLILQRAEENAAQLSKALLAVGLDDEFDPMHDAGNTNSTEPGAENKTRKSPALIRVEEELNRVADLDRQLKENGASLAERQKLWDAVPIRLRPDDVVEDLRAFALTQRLVLDETKESKEESWNRMVGDLAKSGGKIVGSILSSIGVTATSIDFAMPVDGAGGGGLGKQTEDGTRTKGHYGEDLDGASFKDYQKRLWAIAQCFQVIETAIVTIDKMSKEPKPKDFDDPEKAADQKKLIAQRNAAMSEEIGATFSKVMTVKTVLSILISHVKLSPLGALPQANGIMTACQGFLTLADAYEAQLKANFMSKELEAIEAKRSIASRTDDVGLAVEAIVVAAGDKLEQTMKARNAATATGVGKVARGTGTVTGSSGEMISGVILFVGGVLAEFGGALYGLKNAKGDYDKASSDSERHLQRLREAALGDSDAKKEIMRDCPFYCALYLGHAVSEGNEEAIDLMNTMNFEDAEDFKNYDAYMIQKAMLWSLGKDSLAPGSDTAGSVLYDAVETKVTAVKEAAVRAADWVAGSRETGERIKELDLGKPVLTAASWAKYKDESDKGGIKFKKTGIKDHLALFEKHSLQISEKGGINVKHADATLDALEGVIVALSNYVPEWKTQPEGGYAPEGAIVFCIAMRDLAESERRLTSQRFYDTKTYPNAVCPAPHTYQSNLTEAGFQGQVKDAKKIGLKISEDAKAAALIGGCETSEQLFRTSLRQDATHAGGMAGVYKEALDAIGDVQAKNGSTFPGLNEDFHAYLASLVRQCLIKISEWKGYTQIKNAEFAISGEVQATVASFDANLKNGHATLLEARKAEEGKIRSLIKSIEDIHYPGMEADTAPKDKKAEYLDKVEKAWVEFSWGLGTYRRICAEHKPWRNYLEKLMAIADTNAKEYGRRKLAIQKS